MPLANVPESASTIGGFPVFPQGSLIARAICSLKDSEMLTCVMMPTWAGDIRQATRSSRKALGLSITKTGIIAGESILLLEIPETVISEREQCGTAWIQRGSGSLASSQYAQACLSLGELQGVNVITKRSKTNNPLEALACLWCADVFWRNHLPLHRNALSAGRRCYPDKAAKEAIARFLGFAPGITGPLETWVPSKTTIPDSRTFAPPVQRAGRKVTLTVHTLR